MKSWTQKLNGTEFKVMRLNDAPMSAPVLDNPEIAINYLREQLPNSVRYNQDTENLIAIFVNTRRRPIGFEIVSNGTLDTLLVHAREVFKPAILLGAAAIIIAHNHPSGDPTPSEGDIKVTRDMVRAGQLLKIEVLDHIILGDASLPKSYSSLKELGYFYS